MLYFRLMKESRENVPSLRDLLKEPMDAFFIQSRRDLYKIFKNNDSYTRAGYQIASELSLLSNQEIREKVTTFETSSNLQHNDNFNTWEECVEEAEEYLQEHVESGVLKKCKPEFVKAIVLRRACAAMEAETLLSELDSTKLPAYRGTSLQREAVKSLCKDAVLHFYPDLPPGIQRDSSAQNYLKLTIGKNNLY